MAEPVTNRPTTTSLQQCAEEWRSTLLVSAAGTCLTVALVYPFPMSGRHWNAIFDMAHAPVFFCVFVAMEVLLDRSFLSRDRSGMNQRKFANHRLFYLAAILFMLGLACEFTQKFVNRHPSILDIAANGIGLAAGALFCFRRRLDGKSSRVVSLAVILGMMIVPVLSPISELFECILQRYDFPRLASFERRQEMFAWNGHEAKLSIDPSWSTDGSASLQILAVSNDFPGALMVWPLTDWSNYATLELDVFNPNLADLHFGITIADTIHVKTGYEPSDRYNIQLALKPMSTKRISIALKDVADAPATRQMVMTRISSINIFMISPADAFRLNVDNVYLAR